MNAEDLLINIKTHLENIPEFNDRINITPTTGDPNEIQTDVSLIIFGKKSDGYYPRFMVSINELNK